MTNTLTEKGTKRNIEDLYKSIESIREALQDAVQLASEAAIVAEGFGGEISRVITSQLSTYFVPTISKYIDDENTPGAMTPLVTFLDSVPLAMTRQPATPVIAPPPAPAPAPETAPQPEEAVAAPEEPAEGSYASKQQESVKKMVEVFENDYEDDSWDELSDIDNDTEFEDDYGEDEEDVCPQCGESFRNWEEDALGDLYCPGCGLVIPADNDFLNDVEPIDVSPIENELALEQQETDELVNDMLDEPILESKKRQREEVRYPVGSEPEQEEEEEFEDFGGNDLDLEDGGFESEELEGESLEDFDQGMPEELDDSIDFDSDGYDAQYRKEVAGSDEFEESLDLDFLKKYNKRA